jgi:hypothetical protein
MKLTLIVDNLSKIRWSVDASYNVHDDCSCRGAQRSNNVIRPQGANQFLG